MINCLTSFQKFLAALWAMTGFAIMIAICATERVVLGIMASDTVTNGLGSIGGITAVIVIACYIGFSMTQRNDFEFLDKLHHTFLASFFKNRRSERQVHVWVAEKQITEAWAEYSIRTRRKANFENICAFMASEYETEIEALAEWRKLGASQKLLSREQVKGVFHGIALNLAAD
jgi:hypothetical protein